MFGKFLKIFILISLIGLSEFAFAQVQTNEISINGYTISNVNRDQLLGLRYKAIGDLLVRKRAQSLAIKYYENAIRYLKDEAEIYFRLGDIYLSQKIYNLAARYYSLAVQKYDLKSNVSRGREKRYLALIREGVSWQKDGEKEAARKIAKSLRDEDDRMLREYPNLKNELDRFYRLVYGSYAIFLKD